MDSTGRTDKTALLNQLKIDRHDSPQDNRHWLWWGAAAVGLVVVVLVGYTVAAPSGIPIQVAVAQQTTADSGRRGASTLDASGYIVARRQATVSSKATGRVRAVLIEEGQEVAEGEVIARLDDSNTQIALSQARAQLAEAEANLAAARAAHENAIPIFERNQTLFAKGTVSALAFDNAKAAYDSARLAVDVAARRVGVAQANLQAAEQHQADTIIRAPFAGVVTVKAAQAGETVSPVSAGGGFTRTGIGTVVDMDSLELEVDVSENFINRVSANQSAIVRLNAYPDWDIPARVIAVIPTADQAKATVKVRIGFDVKDPRILPEMGARVSFLQPESETQSAAPVNAVVIPREAVQANSDTGVVFVIDGNRVERRAVRLGGSGRDGQTVISGLTPGTRVAVGDLAQLADQSKIRIID